MLGRFTEVTKEFAILGLVSLLELLILPRSTVGNKRLLVPLLLIAPASLLTAARLVLILRYIIEGEVANQVDHVLHLLSLKTLLLLHTVTDQVRDRPNCLVGVVVNLKGRIL